MHTTASLLSLLALSSLSACAPSRADVAAPNQDALAPSGGDAADAWFSLHDPTVLDEGGDGVWDAGEILTLRFSFTNQKGDHYGYPGVELSTDTAEVTALGGENWWYGIAAGETYEVEARFEAAPSLDEGSLVTLIASAAALNCEGDVPPEQEVYCPDPNPLFVPVRLGAAL
jgi:hypothetical protein